MPWIMQASGKQIKDGAVSDNHIAASAAIAESKLALTFSTQSLLDNAVRIDANRTIAEGIFITFPSTGLYVKDSVNAKTYCVTFQNGVMVLTEVQ